MRWLGTTGGPFLILAEDAIADWAGIAGDDYARACDIEERVGVISVGKTQALVLDVEPMGTVWKR